MDAGSPTSQYSEPASSDSLYADPPKNASMSEADKKLAKDLERLRIAAETYEREEEAGSNLLQAQDALLESLEKSNKTHQKTISEAVDEICNLRRTIELYQQREGANLRRIQLLERELTNSAAEHNQKLATLRQKVNEHDAAQVAKIEALEAKVEQSQVFMDVALHLAQDDERRREERQQQRQLDTVRSTVRYAEKASQTTAMILPPPVRPTVNITVNVKAGDTKSNGFLRRVRNAFHGSFIRMHGPDAAVEQVQRQLLRSTAEDTQRQDQYRQMQQRVHDLQMGYSQVALQRDIADAELQQAQPQLVRLKADNDALRVQASINQEVIKNLRQQG